MKGFTSLSAWAVHTELLTEADFCAVYDLDGTLANSAWRMEEVARHSHASCKADSVMNAHLLVERNHHTIIILTGRSEEFRKQTTDWIHHTFVAWLRAVDPEFHLTYLLVMRPECDVTVTHRFKVRAMKALFNFPDASYHEPFPFTFYDDDRRNVEAFRDEGWDAHWICEDDESE